MTIIKGSVYVGGNCASLATVKSNPMVELKIGSYVIADKVFLGNNGAGMVSPEVLEHYAKDIGSDNQLVTRGEGSFFSNLTLTDPSVFSGYMDGVTMNLQPSVVFDSRANGDPADYIDNTSYVGSFYCGGNVGSMSIPNKNIYKIDRGLNIYEKFVGGCNNADVKAGTYNAAYYGGVLGSKTEQANYTEGGKIKDRLQIDLENLTITPLRWDEITGGLIWNTNKWVNYAAVEDGTTLTAGEK